MSFLLPPCEEIPSEALPASDTISSPKSDMSASEPFISKGTVEHSSNYEFLLKISGPAEGEGQGVLQPPHFFRNFKELLRKRCFQPPPPPPTLSHYSAPPHFQSSSAGPGYTTFFVFGSRFHRQNLPILKRSPLFTH